MSEYDIVAKGPLKIKGDCGTKKKKKKKDKDKDKELKKNLQDTVQLDGEMMKKFEVKSTKAELTFQKMQEKMQNKRIMEIASMTHKQRVEEFNKHLDSLTEHFDIPKVSWTK